MSAKNRATVKMRFPAGDVIHEWESFSIRDTFTDPLGSACVVTRPSRENIPAHLLKFSKGDLVRILVNNVTVGSFRIQSIRRHIGRDGMSFAVECASPLCTPYEATVDPDIAKHFPTDVPVINTVLEALSPFGFNELLGDRAANLSAISGKDPVGGEGPIVPNLLKIQDAKAQYGETAYGFCSRIFTRLGVALRCDHPGKLLLSAPDYKQAPLYSLVQDFKRDRAGDRMLDGIQIEDSNEDQFSEVTVRGVAPDKPGQTYTAPPEATVRSSDLYPNRPTYRSSTAPYKPKFIMDKNARDKARCESVAKLAMGIRATRAFSVTCEVDGFVSSTGAVWAVDTVANVFIEIEGLNEPMWILERTFMQDRSGGQKTRLKLLPLGALQFGDAPG